MKSRAHPTRLEGLRFTAKTRVLSLLRILQDLHHPLPRHDRREGPPPYPERLAHSESRLWTHATPSEFTLVAGKIENLRIAARKLNGIVVPAGGTFSFWRQVGPPRRRRGFVDGRELREGCLVPSPGGGLCQLSNALYDAALQAGFEILERHAHTQVIPGSLAELGRDATVFWRHVDLRFRANTPWHLTVVLEADRLVVAIHGPVPAPEPTPDPKPPLRKAPSLSLGACDTCGVETCATHLESPTPGQVGPRSAFLLDAWWPEFEGYLHAGAQPGDRILTPWPLPGGRHPWGAGLPLARRGAPFLALLRSLASRRLRSQGAVRQAALLRWDERMAQSIAQWLRPEDSHLVVSQNWLPFLWAEGHLGGRTFDVLVHRQPLDRLQDHLDSALRDHPESPTLGDFRAPAPVVQWEREALTLARRWVTPHVALADQGGAKAHRVPWCTPPALPRTPRPGHILFPASTLGRKGAHALRQAIRGLPGVTLHLGGPVLEAPDFWAGLPVSTDGGNLLDMEAVVLPAAIEHQPRTLLRALAAGIPVVATPACGLPPQPGLHLVPFDHPEALRESLAGLLGGPR